MSMTIPDLKILTTRVQPIIQETAAFIRSNYGKVMDNEIEEKAENSLVSFVDKKAEEQLVKGLGNLLPHAGFITEEETPDDADKDFVWIIDPLDGTTNFLQSIPIFSISVALRHEDTMIAGWVFDVMQNDCYHAILNDGAKLNNLPIGVSSRSQMDHSIIVTGFPYDEKNMLPDLVSVFNRFLTEARGIRRLGSAAIDLAYTAAGRFDAYYERTLNIWDVAAGTLLVKEAGGEVSDFDGGNTYIEKKELVASNKTIHKQVLGLIHL